MQWTGRPLVENSIVERRFEIDGRDDRIPGLLWTPEDASGSRPLVALGHGGRLHKRTGYILGLAQRLVGNHGFAAVAIDAPDHGDRRPPGEAGSGDAGRARRADPQTRAEMTARAVQELRDAVYAVQKVGEVGFGPLGYWGLSLGTLIGLPYLADETQAKAAVLGLMGLFNPSYAELAASVKIPTMFIVQWDDDIVPRDGALGLFDALGAQDKRLHAYPGRHVEVPPDAFDTSERFLAQHLAT